MSGEDQQGSGTGPDGMSILIGLALFVLPVVFLYLIIQLWPTPGSAGLSQWRSEIALIAKLQQRQATLPTLIQEEQTKLRDPTLASVKPRIEEEIKKLKKEESSLPADIAAAQARRDKAIANAQLDAQEQRLDAVFGLGVLASIEVRLLAIVAMCGALGASIGAGRGYAYHHGMGTFDTRWHWWYFLRIPCGMGIAVAFYAVLRGGLVPVQFGNESKALDSINPLGFAAIGVLGGMFANEAFAKLRDVMTALFAQGDKAADPVSFPFNAAKLDGTERKSLTLTGADLSKVKAVNIDGKPATIDTQRSKDSIKVAFAEALVDGKKSVEVMVTFENGKTAKKSMPIE